MSNAPHRVSNRLIHTETDAESVAAHSRQCKVAHFIFLVSRVGSTFDGFPSRKRIPGVASADSLFVRKKALVATVRDSPPAGGALEAYRVAEVWMEFTREGDCAFAKRVERPRRDLSVVAVILPSRNAKREGRSESQESGGS